MAAADTALRRIRASLRAAKQNPLALKAVANSGVDVRLDKLADDVEQTTQQTDTAAAAAIAGPRPGALVNNRIARQRRK